MRPFPAPGELGSIAFHGFWKRYGGSQGDTLDLDAGELASSPHHGLLPPNLIHAGPVANLGHRAVSDCPTKALPAFK